ncbi:MAG: response regulator [Bacteroidetes bacterium]|nr:response regulator [Bacteroidota bacterium]
METQGLNLFIVDDNKLLVTDLKHYLQTRFGAGINISTFSDGESCLKMVDKNTNIVILDYFLDGKNGLEVLKEIKTINPNTEVIMLSSNEDIVLAIESFRQGAKDYVIKGYGSWKKITHLVNHIITEPIRIMVREFGVSKFMATFLFTFIIMGATVLGVLYGMGWI